MVSLSYVLAEKCKFYAKFVEVAQLAIAKARTIIIKSDFILNLISGTIILAFYSLILVISVPPIFCFLVRKRDCAVVFENDHNL